MGCIAYDQGDMEYVRAKDIQISNDPNTRTNYVGGLVGYGERPLEHCSAVGSEGDRGGSKDFTFKISINSETGRASEYTGGLASSITTMPVTAMWIASASPEEGIPEVWPVMRISITEPVTILR